METRARRVRDEKGETLVELIVAIAILGIAAVAILAGLMLSVKTSDQGRKLATSGAYVRSWAEEIQSSVSAANALQACPAYLTSFTALQTANPQLIPLTPACAASDVTDGIQKVTLTVTSNGDATHPTSSESLVVFLRKPCNAAGASPCG
jgi:type II secretory pathway pseudopilin PulG